VVAGREASPGDRRIVDKGKRYWAFEEGAAKIGWGKPGDFARCMTEVQAAVTKDGKKPMPDSMIKGYCAELHKMATGATPGHAAGEQAHKH
jgi:hypothetical protein